MKVETKKVECVRILDAAGLDPVTAVIQDIGPGTGRLVVECFGEAWACYWGAMGNSTLREFVCACGTDYLVNAMRRNGRHTKKEEAYLSRIVRTVQKALSIPDRAMDVAGKLLSRMEGVRVSQGGPWNSEANRIFLQDAVAAVLAEGWEPTPESIEVIATGPQLAADEAMEVFPSFEKMAAILRQIFDEETES